MNKTLRTRRNSPSNANKSRNIEYLFYYFPILYSQNVSIDYEITYVAHFSNGYNYEQTRCGFLRASPEHLIEKILEDIGSEFADRQPYPCEASTGISS